MPEPESHDRYFDDKYPLLRMRRHEKNENLYTLLSGQHKDKLVYYEDGVYFLNPKMNEEFTYYEDVEGDLDLTEYKIAPKKNQTHYNYTENDAVLFDIDALLEMVELRSDIDNDEQNIKNDNYAALMKDGTVFPAIEIQGTTLLQGNHRIRASQAAGFTRIPVRDLTEKKVNK